MNMNPYRMLTMYLGNSCNFNCKYCSEAGANTGDFGITQETLPFFKENLKKFLKENKIQTLQFFGGEPMMYYDEMIDIARYTKDIAPEVQFTMITNGSLMNMKRAKELMELDFGIAVSHDGPYQEEQRNKDFLKTNPEPFQYYLECDPKKEIMMSFASTLSYPNYDYLAVYEYFENWRIKNKVERIPKVVCELAHGCLDRVDIRKENEDAFYDKWCLMLDKVMKNMVAGIKEDNFMTYEYRQYYHLLRQGLNFFNSNGKASLRCGQGKERVSVDHKGDVYVCHNVSLDKDYYRGNLFENNLKDWDYSRYIQSQKCNECEARVFCNCMCPLITIEEQQESFCKYKKAEYTRLLGAVVEIAPILMLKGERN